MRVAFFCSQNNCLPTRTNLVSSNPNIFNLFSISSNFYSIDFTKYNEILFLLPFREHFTKLRTILILKEDKISRYLKNLLSAIAQRKEVL